MMQGLKLFTRCSGQGTWNLASFHSPHSLTWRWIVSFSLFRGGEAKVWPLWHSYRTNPNLLQCGFRVPFIGMVRLSQQKPMWYRDLYVKLRDERDKPLEATPPNQSRPSFTVIDGGASVH